MIGYTVSEQIVQTPTNDNNKTQLLMEMFFFSFWLHIFEKWFF